MMVCIRAFDAYVGGVLKSYAIGDTIAADEAKELNLLAKPELAKRQKPKGTK